MNMANLHLVTGYAGQAHVTSVDQGSMHVNVFGTGECVIGRGNQFAATVISNNAIRIADGELIMKGRQVRLDKGSHVDLTIENGEQGYNRNDLIVARYTKDANTSIEQVNLVVIKGTAVASTETASDPEYTTGDIISGTATLHDMPLYRVPLTGLNVGELECLFTTKMTIDGRLNQKADKNHASTYDSFGVGTGTAYGHLKLASVYKDESVQALPSGGGIGGGTAATPYAVNAVYNIANNAQTLAKAALPKTGGEVTGSLTIKNGLTASLKKPVMIGECQFDLTNNVPLDQMGVVATAGGFMAATLGTKIVSANPGDVRVLLFTNAQLATYTGLNTSDVQAEKVSLVASNGDFSAYQHPIVAVRYNSTGNWYIMRSDGLPFDGADVRVNFILAVGQ